eukprot:TRINITY_DN66571_c11_g2_i1.p1 TRINITY_DN66571_c11_g2~~TRINITY_DN66571_c11_g2_i1.p1  ORF type:complete len:574 (-),score=121.07 TRINITY_DN66571_c11_g2_i1:495-2216(-)
MDQSQATDKRHRPASSRPCYKLSVELLSTYKKINELFYENKRKKPGGDPKKPLYNKGYDDESGNYIVQTGEEIAGRYIVQDLLGKGSFGVVVKAHDHRREECVAIKIIKNKVQFFHQAQVEIDILTKLKQNSEEEHNIVQLKKMFTWQDHLCIVFELLSFNLYDLLKYTKFKGVSLNLIRKFATQILKTLEFLASPAIGVIHCDLKPENILLKNHKRSAIKVIDFGSSCYVNKRMFKYIQSRFYRSPEVILGHSYDCAIDMWSLACILAEMHTGQPLFDGRDEAEQMCKMAAVLNIPPQKLIETAPKKKNFFAFDPKNKKWILAPPNKDPNKYPKTTVDDILGVHTGGPEGRRKGAAGHTEADYLLFSDLVKKMLTYNAKDRLTPTEALSHPFLTQHEDVTKVPLSPSSAASRHRSRSREASSRERSHSHSSAAAGSHHHPPTVNHNTASTTASSATVTAVGTTSAHLPTGAATVTASTTSPSVHGAYANAQTSQTAGYSHYPLSPHSPRSTAATRSLSAHGTSVHSHTASAAAPDSPLRTCAASVHTTQQPQTPLSEMPVQHLTDPTTTSVC